MNKERREWLECIIGKIEELQEEIDVVLEAENITYSNMPVGIRCSDKGTVSFVAIKELNNAIDFLEDGIECIEEVISYSKK